MHRFNGGPWEGPGVDPVSSKEPASNGLEMGTIGWSDDGGSAYSLGSGENDGVALVNVTLFAGKDPLQALKAGVGQGKQILCQLSQDIQIMPTYGTRVMVAMPGPNPTMAGHSVVMASLGNTNWKRAGNTSEGDLIIPAPGGTGVLTLKGTGGMSFTTTADDGSTIGASLGPDGLHVILGVLGAIHFDQYGLRGNVGGGPGFQFTQIGGLPPPFDTICGSVAQINAGTIKLDGLQNLIGPDLAETTWCPGAVYNDINGPPAPSPLLGTLVATLPAYMAAVNTVLSSLLAQPLYTGVTPAQIAALDAAQADLVIGIDQAATVLTTPTVKFGYPITPPV
jgi:hypothetical protein